MIEVDGGIHQQQVEYDTEREKVLVARGLRIVRFKNEEVRQDLRGVLIRIQAACAEAT